MIVLQVMRCSLVGSIAVYVASFALGGNPELGLLIAIVAATGIVLSSLGCVVAQAARFLANRKHKRTAKSE